jgi:hypothetical protein
MKEELDRKAWFFSPHSSSFITKNERIKWTSVAFPLVKDNGEKSKK